MSEKKVTVLFVTVDMIGHLNPCIAIAQQLVSLGHRAVFALEKSWKGTLSQYTGIEERYYCDPTRDPALSPNDYWLACTSKMLNTFPLEGVEKVKHANPNNWLNLLHTLLNVDDQLVQIIETLQPNVIVVDSFATVPAVFHSGIPWVRSFSAAPLSFVRSDDLPPPGSGLPTNGDRAVWQAYRDAGKEMMGDRMVHFERMMQEKYSIPPPPPGRAGHISPHLNIYTYPEELDYLQYRPLPETFMRLDHLVRLKEADTSFTIPETFLKHNLGKLIYVSLGSVGSTDIEFMKRLIGILAQSPNRFIFSLGPHWQQLQPLLSTNMFGTRFVPQTNVLPLVDLVFTHGGNNSVLESLYFGKPMIINPLFAEQPENAQRVSEIGYGHRINAYTCQPSELLEKMEQLLANEELKQKLSILSEKMQKSNSTLKAALAIVQVAK